MITFEVEDVNTGRRYIAMQIQTIKADGTSKDTYSVNGNRYTPSEFWSKFRQVVKDV